MISGPKVKGVKARESKMLIGSDIEIVSRVSQFGSSLRSIAAQGAFSVAGLRDENSFRQQEDEVEGFVAEMVRQI
jgi:hypothetical protein